MVPTQFVFGMQLRIGIKTVGSVPTNNQPSKSPAVVAPHKLAKGARTKAQLRRWFRSLLKPTLSISEVSELAVAIVLANEIPQIRADLAAAAACAAFLAVLGRALLAKRQRSVNGLSEIPS